MELICTLTGVALKRPSTDPSARVSRRKYDALDAPYRGRLGHLSELDSLNRYDAPGTRTLYLAGSAATAFAEVLAPFRQKVSSISSLAKDAAALSLSTQQYLELVQEEWQQIGFLAPGFLPASWRDDRQIHLIVPPLAGFWVDIESPHTISAFYELLRESKNRFYRQALEEVGVNELDVGLLRGQNRKATTILSAMLRGTTVEGGRTPLGIAYESKHGFGNCFAVYTDRHNDVPTSEGEHPTLIGSGDITRYNPDLTLVSGLFGLTIL